MTISKIEFEIGHKFTKLEYKILTIIGKDPIRGYLQGEIIEFVRQENSDFSKEVIMQALEILTDITVLERKDIDGKTYFMVKYANLV